MDCGWFMGYYVVRAVVVHGPETAMVHPISIKQLVKQSPICRDRVIYVEQQTSNQGSLTSSYKQNIHGFHEVMEKTQL